MTKLVVVESPAKAKTIEKYLPDGYKVRASNGHIRDLPDNAGQMPKKYKSKHWASLGVNVDEDFDAFYVVKGARSKKALASLKKELKNADELLLATDEDREGEAISWHLIEELKPKVPVKRMVFNEITKSAINEALQNTREVDTSLVEAQETRRILDRLVGYPLSLLVAKKIKYGLSAGRVQSPAVFLIVDRERERRRFRMGTYWDLQAELNKDGESFKAALHNIDGTRLASGKDFDESTGKIAEGKDVLLLGEEEATRLVEGLEKKPLTVDAITERQYSTRPKPPFTTSTLQQDASRKLNMSARDTMSIAQRLYENGLITYMRTDSTNLSKQALSAARGAARNLYGDEYVPDKPRFYGKKSKGAQEAHEAIRPTGDAFTHPDKAGLRGRERKLYDLIWKRTVACQMNDAKKTSIRVDLLAEVDGKTLNFRANGNRIDFPGFIRAYVEGSDDPDAVLDDQETLLPKLSEDENVPVDSVEPIRHETKPPARYTEASLVQKLEEEGIGRPSTYATVIQKVSDGRFSKKQGKSLVPTFMAFAVVNFLETYFPELVDLSFTARMEDDLDSIARGEGSKVDYLHEFYRRKGAFADQVESGEETIEPREVRAVPLEELDNITLRVGRYGAYAQIGEDGEEKTVNIPDTIPPADLTVAMVLELLEEREKGPEVLGEHPDSGEPIFIMTGRYGPYLQLGERSDDNKKPPTASVPKGTEPSEVSLEHAVKLLSLPRELGPHPDGGKVEAAIGRYGPYVKHKKDYRNIPEEHDVFTIELEDALALLKEPKKGRRSRQKVLKDLGKHPDTGEAINVLDGRYGPYVKSGKTNASLPKGVKPDDMTLEKAVELIAEKRA